MKTTMKRLLQIARKHREERLTPEERADVFQDLAEQERTIRALELRAGCVEPAGEVPASPFGRRHHQVPS